MDTFQIKEINVTGASDRNTVLIKQTAVELMKGSIGFIIPKTSVFFYPQQEINSSIKGNFPSLSSVKVNTGLTGSLEIVVEERKQSAFWCSGIQVCYFMDNAGFVFGRASEGDSASDTLYIKYHGLITGDPVNNIFGNKDLGENFFDNLNAFISDLKNSGIDISDVNVVDIDNAELTTRSGFGIKFDPTELSKPELYKNLNLFLNNMKTSNGGNLPAFSYIDARYGNKIFYRLK
jgi:hypothetical protein